MQTGSTKVQMENVLYCIVCHNEKLSKCVNKKIKSHKKLNSMSPLPAIMSFSRESCTDREFLKSPRCKNVN